MLDQGINQNRAARPGAGPVEPIGAVAAQATRHERARNQFRRLVGQQLDDFSWQAFAQQRPSGARLVEQLLEELVAMPNSA